MANIKYTDGSTKKRAIAIPVVGGIRAMWSVDCIHLDVTKLEGRDYAWAVANIKQTERMNSERLPAVWFPGTFGLQCDVMYCDDERIVVLNGVTAFELVNVTEYDIWRDHHGKIKAFPATKQFISDTDAPYGFAYHEQRVTASSARDAINVYRKGK